MDFLLNVSGVHTAASIAGRVPGVGAGIGSAAGPIKAMWANTGVGSAGALAMQFNTSRIIGA